MDKAGENNGNSPFRWNPDKHDSTALPEIKKILAKCSCGGTLFVHITQFVIIDDGKDKSIEYPTVGPMCTKCNNIVDLNKFIRNQLGVK